MLQRLSARLMQWSSLWTLALATGAYLYFLATIMPGQSALSSVYAGAWGAPDRHLFYTPAELYAQVATWGAAGRADYIGFRLGLDILWALVYTAFLVTALGCTGRSAFPPGDRRRLFNLVPLVTLACDYAENAAGIILVASFPTRLDALARVAAAITAGKWLSMGLAHCLLLYALVLAIRGAVRRRRARITGAAEPPPSP